MLTTQTTGETYRRKYPLYTSIKIRHSNLDETDEEEEKSLRSTSGTVTRFFTKTD